MFARVEIGVTKFPKKTSKKNAILAPEIIEQKPQTETTEFPRGSISS